MLSFGSEPGGCSLKSSWILYTLLCPIKNSPRLLELLETVVESSHHGVPCITEWRILYMFRCPASSQYLLLPITLRTINLVHNKFGYNNFGYDNFSHKFRNHLVYNNFSQIFDFSRPLLLLFSWFILQVLAIFFNLYSPNSYFFFL